MPSWREWWYALIKRPMPAPATPHEDDTELRRPDWTPPEESK